MRARVAGAGVWGAGCEGLADLARRVAGDVPDGAVTVPKPALLPARELRRAPAFMRLAVEVADQAVRAARLDPREVQAVFTSGIADSEITDYMCRTLAGADKLLSPTRFHNSVHNAAAGCWSIATGSTRAATFVAAGRASVGAALLEALAQVAVERVPVLLVATDVPVPGPLVDVHGEGALFGGAIVLCPVDARVATEPGRELVANTVAPSLDTSLDPSRDPSLAKRDAPPPNPALSMLPLLEALLASASWRTRLPVGTGTGLEIGLAAGAPLEAGP